MSDAAAEPRFGESLYGKPIVISEAYPLPAVRVLMIMGTALLGVITLLHLAALVVLPMVRRRKALLDIEQPERAYGGRGSGSTFAYRMVRRDVDHYHDSMASSMDDEDSDDSEVEVVGARLWRRRIEWCLVIAWMYVLVIVVHTTHYIDNIARPVAYFEPRYLYERAIFSEMDKTFMFNFPLSCVGMFAAHALRRGCVEERPSIMGSVDRGSLKTACWLFYIYLAGSYMTLGHYNVEPFWSYSIWLHCTIGGEGVVATLLLLSVVAMHLAIAYPSPRPSFRSSAVPENSHRMPSASVPSSATATATTAAAATTATTTTTTTAATTKTTVRQRRTQ